MPWCFITFVTVFSYGNLLSINAYYLTMPAVELNHGFCDMFLMPDLQRYSEVEHSYILELKFLPKDKFDAQSASQWDARGGADSRLCQR